jgi:hypothetical protein
MAAVRPTTKTDAFGHVAFVEAVNPDGTITVSEFNAGGTGAGRTWTGKPSDRGFTKFVDLGVKSSLLPGSTGTNPVSNGGWQGAFQSNTGELWVVGRDTKPLGLGMSAGTSPAITTLSDGTWQALFQANTGEIWAVGRDTRPLGLGMAAGTSPAITALSNGGWQGAFQSNTGELWVVGRDTKPLGLGMRAGTSPAIR